MSKRIDIKDIFDFSDIGSLQEFEKRVSNVTTLLTNLSAVIQKDMSKNANILNEFKKALESTKDIQVLSAIEMQVIKLTDAQKKLKDENEKVVKSNTELNDSATKTKTNLTELEKLQNKLADSTKAEAVEVAKLKIQIQEQNKATKEQAKESMNLLTAYQKLAIETNKAKQEAKNLGAQYGSTSKEFVEAAKKAKKLNDELVAIDGKVGDHQRKVGKYENALNGLEGRFGSVGRALQGFGLDLGSIASMPNPFMGVMGHMAQFAKASLTFLLSPIGLVMGAVGALVALFQSNKHIWQDFDQGQANLAAVLGKSKDEMVALREEAKRLGSVTSFTATQVTELQTELSKLGFSEKEIIDSSEAILALAAATGKGLGDVAGIVGTTLRSMGIDAKDADKAIDVMAKSFSSSALDIEKWRETMKYVGPIAKTAGVGIEELSGYMSVLADAGISGSSAGTALRRILSDMALKGKPVKEALADLSKTGLDLGASYDEVGRTAQSALLIITENEEKVNRLTEAYKNSEGSVKKMAETQLNTIEGSTKLMQSAWEGFVLSIEDGNGIIAESQIALNKILIFSFGYMQRAWKTVEDSFRTLKQPFVELGQSFKELFDLFDFGGAKIDWITVLLIPLKVSLNSLTTLIKVLVLTFKTAIDITVALWTEIKNLTSGLGESTNGFTKFITKFEIVQKSIDYVKAKIKSLTDVIVDLPKYLNGMSSAFFKTFEVIGNRASKFFKNISDGIKGVLTFDADLIVQATKSQLSNFENAGREIGEAFTKGFNESKKEDAKKDTATDSKVDAQALMDKLEAEAKAEAERLELRKKAFENATKEQEKQKNTELLKNKERLIAKEISEEQFNKNISDIELKYLGLKNDLQKKYNEENLATLNTIADKRIQLINEKAKAEKDAVENWYKEETDLIEVAYQEQNLKLKEQLLAKEITEEDYRAKQLQAELDYLAKKKALNDQFGKANIDIKTKETDLLIAEQKRLQAEQKALADKEKEDKKQQQQDIANDVITKAITDSLQSRIQSEILVAGITAFRRSIEGGKTIEQAGQDGAKAVLAAKIIQIAAKNQKGFHDGGYTGNGNEYDVAGVVHKGEFVATKKITDKYNFKGWSANRFDNEVQLGYFDKFKKVNQKIETETNLRERIIIENNNDVLVKAIQDLPSKMPKTDFSWYGKDLIQTKKENNITRKTTYKSVR